MTLYKENGELYEVIKVGSIPGQPLGVSSDSIPSTSNNKSSGGLGNGEIWNDGATGDDVSAYGTITVSIYSDKDSAADGLKFEASFDQSTWYAMESYTYKTAAGLQVYSMAPGAKYFRTRFINGVIPSAVTRIETSYRQCYTKPSSHRISDVITGEKDAELVKAVLAAMKPDTTFTDIHCTAGGNLKVSVEEVNGIDPLPTRVPARSATTTSVSGSATSVTLISGNANRAGLSIHNLSSANLLVSYTSPATSGNCFTRMTSGQYLQFDQQLVASGAIYGIWDSAVGTAQVTEYV